MSAPLPLYPERPRTRGDCLGGERPCPWVGCRYNLLLDRSEGHGRGNHRPRLIALRNATPAEAEVLTERLADEAAAAIWSCALDVADQGGVSDASGLPDPDDEAQRRTHGQSDHTLSDLAEAMGVTRERIRQLEFSGIRKFRRNAAAMRLTVELGGDHGRR